MVQKHVQAVFKNASTGPKNDGNKNLYFSYISFVSKKMKCVFQISQTMREHFSENLKYESLRNNFAFFFTTSTALFRLPFAERMYPCGMQAILVKLKVIKAFKECGEEKLY